jgi:hypothetical protein
MRRPYLFPREEPGTGGHLHLVEALRSMPAELRRLLHDVPDEALRRRPADGGWSMIEVAGHLRDYAELEYRCLYMMSTQHDPVLPLIDNDASVRDHGYQSADLESILAGVEEFRAETVALLTTLVNWNWARSGQHFLYGRLSIRQYVERIIEHHAEHLADLRRMREAALSGAQA